MPPQEVTAQLGRLPRLRTLQLGFPDRDAHTQATVLVLEGLARLPHLDLQAVMLPSSQAMDDGWAAVVCLGWRMLGTVETQEQQEQRRRVVTALRRLWGTARERDSELPDAVVADLQRWCGDGGAAGEGQGDGAAAGECQGDGDAAGEGQGDVGQPMPRHAQRGR